MVIFDQNITKKDIRMLILFLIFSAIVLFTTNYFLNKGEGPYLPSSELLLENRPFEQ